MTERTIKEQLYEMMSFQFGCGVAEITDDAHMIEDLNADSLDIVELFMDCEEIFGVITDFDEEDGCERVKDVVALIERKAKRI